MVTEINIRGIWGKGDLLWDMEDWLVMGLLMGIYTLDGFVCDGCGGDRYIWI